MAVQSNIFPITGTNLRTFTATKHIATKANVAVWVQDLLDNWTKLNISDYDVITNSIVLNTGVSASDTQQLEVRVADNQNELTDSISDVAIVATNIADINSVADDITKVNSVAANIDAVQSVSGDIANVVITANDIANINIVANYITNGNTVIGSNGQLLGTSTIKPIAYLSNNTSETLTILSGTNGYSVDSLTLNNGASVIVEDGATYKIV